MKSIALGFVRIAYFLAAGPFMVAGWVAAMVWTPLAAGFLWGNRHVDAMLAIHAETWTAKQEGEG